MSYVIWFLLLVIGVSDVQKQRIPNRLVGYLLLSVVVELYLSSSLVWAIHFKGLAVTFAIGFIFYLLRIMAAGDVKLLTVIGLWLGADVMWQVIAYVVVAGGVIGMFYLLLHLASSSYSLAEHLKIYAMQKVASGLKSSQVLVIPFAPAIVIGIAYYFYSF